MKPSFILFTFLSFCCIAIAQQPNTSIKGWAENANGKTISVYRYTDALSQHRVLMCEDVIDDEGSFELSFYSNYTELVTLKVENYSQSFYIEPGRDYKVVIPVFDWTINEKKNIYLSPEVLPVEFKDVKLSELNLSILRFDDVVDSFIYANRIHFDFKFRPNPKYFDTLVMVVNELCPTTGNEFFNRYRRYRLASVQCQFRLASRKYTFQNYIDGQPVLYYDENYMTLFESLYANSIYKGNKYFPIESVANWIERQQLDHMLDTLGVDPFLRNEQIRELAVILTLREAYSYTYYYNRDKVTAMLQAIAASTKFPQHKMIAENLVMQRGMMAPGVKLVDFSLPDADRNEVHLSDFAGKWVYLSFVRVGEPASLAEIETMAYFHDSIMARCNNVEFVTICCDREFQKMYHFLRNGRHSSRYNWVWAHFNGDYNLLEQYQVVSFPTFLLINPEGKLQYNVTPSPADGFLLHGPWEPKKVEEDKKFFLDEYK